jgi:AraC family transcriptional regulator
MRWAEPRGFVAAGTALINVYHDDPGLTDDDRLRVSVCVPVPAGTPAEGDIGRMALPAGPCAVGRFELGVTDYPIAWYAMAGGWMPDSGYEPDDRMPFERYIVGRQGRQPGIEVVDIGMPVRPLRRY